MTGLISFSSSRRVRNIDLSGIFTPPGNSLLKRHDRLIPMINIVFLLLAFFMIAGTVRIATPLDIELPKAASEGTVDERSLTLHLDANGKFALDGKTLDLADAIKLVVKRLEGDPDEKLSIRADRNVPVRIVLPVLSKLRNKGITSVRMIAIKQTDRTL